MSKLLDLDAELAAGAEDAIREVSVKRDTEAATEIERALNQRGKGVKAPPPKMVGLLKRAMKVVDDSPASAAKAAKLCLQALDVEPDYPLANHALAICLERMGRLGRALEFYERAWKLDPQNSEIYINLANVAWQLDMLEGAEKFLRIFMQMEPTSIAGVINLSGVMRDQAKFEDSIEILRTAIYANPENKELWNSLGTTVLETGDAEQALTFYAEALRVDPDFARAHHNTAYAYEVLGKPAEAIKHFREALKGAQSHKDTITMQHGLSLALLSTGQFDEGWDLHQTRLDPAYGRATHFLIDQPRWDGLDINEIKGKRLLWVGEQGLGDEILYLQLGRDLLNALGPDGELRISVERRLVDMVQKAFPEAKVGTHRTIRREAKDLRVVVGFEDDDPCDLWTPFGQPARAFRRSLDDFPKDPVLKPDATDIEHWRDVLSKTGKGMKVGILWKSLKMDAKRSKYFSSFERWKPILKTEGVDFINLQYGDTADDIERIQSKFDVKIHEVDGINLKDDMDQITALARACDLIIGPSNATTNLASSTGATTWLLQPYKNIWTHMGSGQSPWYPSSYSFFCENSGEWTPMMRQVAEALAERVKQNQAA